MNVHVSTVLKFIHTPIKRLFPGPLRFAHPITSMSSRAHLPLHAEETYPVSTRPSDYLSREHKLVLDFMKTATRWLPANPNKDSIRQQVGDTYAKLTPVGLPQADVANLELGPDHFAFDDIINQHDYVLVKGVRGVGKTAFLNYWLTKNTRTLEHQNITWFRIDASKVHASFTSRPQSIEDAYIEYMRVHTVYVVLVYGNYLTQEIATRLGIDTFSPLFRTVVDNLKHTQSRLLADAYHIIKTHLEICLSKRSDKADYSHHVLLEILSKTSKSGQKDRRIITDLFNHIMRQIALRGSGCYIFIDGIDNISWTKRNLFYTSTCRSFSTILSYLKGAFGDRVKIILAARPETIYEIQFTPDGTFPGFNKVSEQSFFVCHIRPPEITQIIRTKIKAARDAESFKHQRDSLTKHLSGGEVTLQAVLTEMERETERYPAEITRAIWESYSHCTRSARISGKIVGFDIDYRRLSPNAILSILYDNDVRAYLDNIIKVFFLAKKISPPARNRLLGRWVVQYAFMNGRPFFDSRVHYRDFDGTRTRANYRDRGSVFPNLFWWDTKLTQSNPSRWHGLVGLRFLQVLNTARLMSCGDLIFLLEALFSYERKVIIETLEAFIAYGLIDIEAAMSEDYMFSEIQEGDLKHLSSIARVTDKGKFYMEFIWLRPDILYFFALDTPLCWAMVEKDTRFVRACRSFASLDYLEDFFLASIPTVITLYLHVINFHDEEIAAIKAIGSSDSLISKVIKKAFDDNITASSVFALPSQAEVMLEEYIKVGMSPRRGRLVSQLGNTLLGLFNR